VEQHGANRQYKKINLYSCRSLGNLKMKKRGGTGKMKGKETIKKER
jgi:hypothetical protein